jgi:hypothetical protein
VLHDNANDLRELSENSEGMEILRVDVGVGLAVVVAESSDFDLCEMNADYCARNFAEIWSLVRCRIRQNSRKKESKLSQLKWWIFHISSHCIEQCYRVLL